MRHIDFHPNALTDDTRYVDKDEREWGAREWWDRWSARAEVATRQVIAAREAGEELTWSSNIWSDLKHFLLKVVFDGQCAYCESRVDDIEFGDAEHFRPKAKVTVMGDDGRDMMIGPERVHPGYYWLAYDWRNLLPACGKCNTGGKRNHFPVKGQYVYSHSEPAARDLDTNEQPLLLHPYRDYPQQHLRFGAHGTVGAIDDDQRGRESIRVYRLYREQLETTRKEYQESAWRDYLLAWATDKEKGDAVLAELRTGRKPHSSAAFDYIMLMVSEMWGSFEGNDGD